jgi:hypothetical protein
MAFLLPDTLIQYYHMSVDADTITVIEWSVKTKGVPGAVLVG